MISRAPGHIVAGALVAAAAAFGAVLVRRTQAPLPSVALGVIAVVYTAVVGFLSVPAGPSAANGLLAAAASFAMAILLLRLTRSGTTCLTAVATCAALSAATAGICVVWTMPAEAAGAALTTLSLAVLGLAARMSIAAAGLTPAFPTVDDPHAPAGVGETQVALAHQTLTGLVAGSSASAALGSVLVACGGLNDGGSRLSASLFSAVIGLVLLLRARTHSDDVSSDRPRGGRDDKYCGRARRHRHFHTGTSSLDGAAQRLCRGGCIGLATRIDGQSRCTPRDRGSGVPRLGIGTALGVLGRRPVRAGSWLSLT